MNYSFHPHAEKELEEIETHYDSEREGLGDQFREEVLATISRILKFPNGCQALSKTVRRCTTKRFPYGIIYYVIPNKVFIVAVAHDRREPDYWTYRT
jgi:plasmid stabilization system protein ParE